MAAKVRSFKEVLGAAEMSIEEGRNLSFESTFYESLPEHDPKTSCSMILAGASLTKSFKTFYMK